MQTDLKTGMRALFRQPAFSAAIVATLAIAIGATVAVSGVIDRLIVRPLRFPDPARLVFVRNSWPLFVDSLRSGASTGTSRVFERVARYEYGRATIGGGNSPQAIKLVRASGDFFRLLGVHPLLGSVFSVDAIQEPIAVISNGLWRSLLGGDSAVVGRSITLNGRTFTVAGVMPETFAFYLRGEESDAWVPLVEEDALMKSAQAEGSGTIARLRTGLTFAQAQAQMNLVFRQIARQHPERRLDAEDRIELIPLRDYWFGALQTPLLMLLGAGLFLLIVACANTTGLMLARAAARRKDVAIRSALGADRWHLVRESLAESLVLGLATTVAGLLLAYWGGNAMLAISPTRIPGADEIGVSGRVIGFALVLALLAASVPGLVSISRVSNGDLARALSAGARSGTFVSRRLRQWLVVIQVAVTVILLVSGGLLLRSFRILRTENTGFDARQVMTLEIAPPDTKFPDQNARLAYYERILAAVRPLPGIERAGMVNYLPFHSGSYMIPVSDPQRPGANEPAFSWSIRIASPEYFRAMRIPLVTGRAFTEADRVDAPMVAILDESAARMMAPGNSAIESVLGKRIVLNLGEPITFEIVGVVGDIRQQGLAIASYPGFYLSAFQRPPSVANVVLRSTVPPVVVFNAVRGALREVDAELPVAALRMLQADISDSVARRKFAVFLSGILAVCALVLSMVGLYALMSQLVAYRAHEIGVRVALGARSGDVVGLVLRQGMIVVGLGLAAGLAAAQATTRLIASLLYGVGANDPRTFAVVSLVVISVAILACGIPARRALNADPMVTLRNE